jgi:hypothetical protein
VEKQLHSLVNRFTAASFQTQYALTTDAEILLFPPQHTSSSSSTGTTARCGLWPVEQDPSIFPYLSPTLSIIVKSIQLSFVRLS